MEIVWTPIFFQVDTTKFSCSKFFRNFWVTTIIPISSRASLPLISRFSCCLITYSTNRPKDSLMCQLHLRNGLTFNLSWDGAKKEKSGRKSAWPLCMTINELAPKERFKPENTLFVGLWYGAGKPTANIQILFLCPLVLKV